MDANDPGPVGGRLEDFLKDQGLAEDVYAVALKRVFAFQLDAARQSRDVSKSAMAEAMETSRTQVARVLDPENVAVSLDLLDRAARAVGKRLKLELVDPS